MAGVATMSKLVLPLLITLSNQGHWLENETNTIEVRWALRGDVAEANLEWTLGLDGVCLARGHVLLLADGEPSIINICAPDVRVRSVVSWSYTLCRKEDGKQITEGARAISIYPDDVFEGLAERLARRRVVVCDDPAGLPQVLKKGGIPHVRIDDVSGGITAGTTSGDIRLSFREYGNDVEIKTVSGDASLLLPRGASFRLSTNTTSGDIDCDFPVTVEGAKAGRKRFEGTVGSGDHAVSVKTTSGDIRILERSG